MGMSLKDRFTQTPRKNAMLGMLKDDHIILNAKDL